LAASAQYDTAKIRLPSTRPEFRSLQDVPGVMFAEVVLIAVKMKLIQPA